MSVAWCVNHLQKLLNDARRCPEAIPLFWCLPPPSSVPNDCLERRDRGENLEKWINPSLSEVDQSPHLNSKRPVQTMTFPCVFANSHGSNRNF